MKKKLFLCLMATTLMLSGCGGSEDTSDSSEEAKVSSEGESISEEDENSESEPETKTEESTADITIEEQLLLEQDGIKITATGIDVEGSFMGSELKLLIENESDKSITVQARNVSVNGYMVDTSMSADIASQKKINDSLTFSESSLEECGIANIADIELSFHVIEAETWDTIFDSDTITIATSCADSYTQSYDDSGDLIYEDDSVKIISKGKTEDSFWGPEVIIYIENKLEENITVQTRDTSIDGFMVDDSFSPEIAGKKRAISNITFMSSDIEENNLSDFNSIETSFHIYYTDSADTLIDTEPITINL